MIDQAFFIALLCALILTPFGLWIANYKEESEQRKLDAKLVELSDELSRKGI
jgi:hypothetical protein